MRNCFLCLCLVTLFAATAIGNQIAITVAEPSGVDRSGWPVTSGIPLAQGELRDHRHAALFDPEGNEIPLQTEILNRGPTERSAGCWSIFRSIWQPTSRKSSY